MTGDEIPPAGVDDLPLLGESLALDLVNSWYGVEPDVVDFLDDPWLDRWVDGLALVHRLDDRAFEHGGAAPLRAVRDAAWTVLHAGVGGTRPTEDAVGALNDAARQMPTIATLVWAAGGPVRRVQPAGAHDGLLASRLAVATIELVTGPDGPRVRRCARPGCSMLFVQHHGHRRFCHPVCSHAMRQERYRRTSR